VTHIVTSRFLVIDEFLPSFVKSQVDVEIHEEEKTDREDSERNISHSVDVKLWSYSNAGGGSTSK
jgi:hypothetical protein